MNQIVVSGILRAMKYQTIALGFVFISAWVVMIPCSYTLGFVFDLGFTGVWIGVPIGNFVLLASFLMIVSTADWEKLAEEASKKELVHHQEVPTNNALLEM